MRGAWELFIQSVILMSLLVDHWRMWGDDVAQEQRRMRLSSMHFWPSEGFRWSDSVLSYVFCTILNFDYLDYAIYT